jgi:regulatory protein
MAGTDEKQFSLADVRESACRYLAIREHSAREIHTKLSRKGYASELIQQALQELTEEGLLSDLRFAGSYTRSRINKLVGPLKIRAELMKRGVDGEIIDDTLSEYQDNFPQCASRWVEKKARGEVTQKEKARLYRSGTSRGFTHDQVMRAIDAYLKVSELS